MIAEKMFHVKHGSYTLLNGVFRENAYVRTRHGVIA